jgi:hypothetical protein
MLLLLFATSAALLPAAQLTVFPGESIQAKITAATAGDEIVIFEGTYSEDLTINKNVVLRKPEGALVYLTGNVTLSGITTAYTLANFKIGGDRTKRLYINNCTAVVAQDLDLTQGYGVDSNSTTKLRLYRIDNTGGSQTRILNCADFETKNCTFGSFYGQNSKLVLRQGTYGAVDVTGSNCYCLGATMTHLAHDGNTVAGAAGTGPSTLVCFRCALPAGDGMRGAIASKATFNWIGYNSAKLFFLAYRGSTTPSGARTLIVGNVFDQNFSLYNGYNLFGQPARASVYINADNGIVRPKVIISNNIVKNLGRQTGMIYDYDSDSKSNGIWIEGSFDFSIQNNIIHDVSQRVVFEDYQGVRSNGIYCADGGRGNISSNIIYNIGNSNAYRTNSNTITWVLGASIACPSDGITISGNFIHRPGVTGFAPGYQAIIDPALNVLGTAPPTFADAATYTLPADSPLRNAGINDPRFNDFDGTRNDIGIWGGTQFDPEGRTTYKPVVLGFDLTPDQTLDGVTNQVQLLNIGAVVLDP